MGAAGLRLFSVPTPTKPWLGGDLGVALVEQCGRLGMSPTVCCLPAELGAVARLLDAVPKVEIALDHAGFLSIGRDDDVLADLANRPNAVIKLSTGVFDDAAVSPSAALGCLARPSGLPGHAEARSHLGQFPS